jgi:radical SAM superfamily enzyme YgiQ (UPF0313 family)
MNNKNHIVLVYPNNSKTIPKIPLSSLSLAAPLIKAGYKVSICDTVFDDYRRMDFSNVLFIGVTAYSDLGIKIGLEISQFFKQNYSDGVVIWGGPHPTILINQTLENKYIDIVCKDEGEQTIVEVAKALTNNNSLIHIKGISWKDKRQVIHHNPSREYIDLDTVVSYPYNMLNIKRYHWSLNERFYYESSRGCPYRCTFCSFDLSKKFRAKSAKKVVDDLEYIKIEFNPREIVFLDSEFFIDKNRVNKICNEIIERSLNLKWSANCRANLIVNYDNNFLSLLEQSGCSELCFGAESGSNKILKLIKKGITREQIIESIKILKPFSINSYIGFMCGFPEETDDDFNLTLSLIDEIKKIDNTVEIGTFQIYTPYPGSELYNLACKMGYNSPNSLEEWAMVKNISFTYKDNLTPWLTKEKAKKYYIATTLVRFDYMIQRERAINFNEKIKVFKNSFLLFYLYKFFTVFFIISKNIRWRYRYFSFAFEWWIWRWIRNKFINYY